MRFLQSDEQGEVFQPELILIDEALEFGYQRAIRSRFEIAVSQAEFLIVVGDDPAIIDPVLGEGRCVCQFARGEHSVLSQSIEADKIAVAGECG